MAAIVVLGATGSIGDSVLDLVENNADLSVFALSAHKNWKKLLVLVERFKPSYAVVTDQKTYQKLLEVLPKHMQTKCLYGDEGLRFVINAQEADVLVCAISGSDGLRSTYDCACSGKKVLLANKESLVVGGDWVMSAAAKHGTVIIPIDSEHHALWQCGFSGSAWEKNDVSSVVITSSGGAVRNIPLTALAQATPKQVCQHPNWSMGKKITVDSATMMNKVLEVLEASDLFDIGGELIEVWYHPQSVVHALVGFRNGSFLSSMSQPDMRVTIASALRWPAYMASGVAHPSLKDLSSLSFDSVDIKRYPLIGLVPALLSAGRCHRIIANAANEAAVDAFLKGKILFTDIADVVLRALDVLPVNTLDSLSDVLLFNSSACQAVKNQVLSKY